MQPGPISEQISTMLQEVTQLAERDRAGRTHAEVRARLTYVHQLLGSLEAELGALRRAADVDPLHERVWRDTRAELRARAPAALRAPAAALIAGDLDLLRLVEYTSASIALLHERRAALRRRAQPDPKGDDSPASL